MGLGHIHSAPSLRRALRLIHNLLLRLIGGGILALLEIGFKRRCRPLLPRQGLWRCGVFRHLNELAMKGCETQAPVACVRPVRRFFCERRPTLP